MENSVLDGRKETEYRVKSGKSTGGGDDMAHHKHTTGKKRQKKRTNEGEGKEKEKEIQKGGGSGEYVGASDDMAARESVQQRQHKYNTHQYQPIMPYMLSNSYMNLQTRERERE